MSEEAFQDNYTKLGLMHAKMKLPFENIISALRMIRDHLLANTQIKQSFIYSIIEEMERFFAKGYLAYNFDDVLNQLAFSIENVKKNYYETDQEILIKPLTWLSEILKHFQVDKRLNLADIESCETCSLTADIEAIKIKEMLKKSILMTHSDQHTLALNMAYFYREGDYMLASFMFSKLFATTVSLSNQIGLAVSQNVIKKLHYDALTGLLLRHSLKDKLEEIFKRSAQRNQSVAILLCDLDHFKKVNDSWGHQAGDRVLALTGKLLKKRQRGDDAAFRYGGEEFLLVASNMTLETAVELSERIRKQVEELEVTWQDHKIPITISIGCLLIEPPYLQKPIESLIEILDKNLYQAKQAGRNRVVATTVLA